MSKKTITISEMKLEGGWLMVKPEREELGKAMAVVRKHKNKLYDLEVKEHRKKRSLDAMHDWCSRNFYHEPKTGATLLTDTKYGYRGYGRNTEK